jgi:AraC family transcriptional regulator
VRLATRDAHSTRILAVTRLIRQHLDDDLDLELLAKQSGLSTYHFHRVFAAIVGEPPASYVRRLRLERAAFRVLYSRRTILEVALDAGYETHEAFTRAFKERFGVPPRRFRAAQQHLVAQHTGAAGAPPETPGGGGWDPSSLERPDDTQLEIATLPPRSMAFVRHVGPYDRTHEAFRRLLEWAGPRRLIEGRHLLGVYWDDQRITPAEHTYCEIGLLVDDDVIGDREIEVRRIPAGDYAVCRHQGDAHDRRRVYDLVHAVWLPERGRRAANAPAIELYPAIEVHSAVRGSPSEFDRVTTMHVPLVPRRAA